MSKGKSLTDKEIEFIKVHTLLEDMTIREIAGYLGRNYYTVYNVAKKLGKNYLHWYTPQEDAFLRNNYQTMKASELADMLHVDVESVYNRAKSLGLKKNSQNGR